MLTTEKFRTENIPVHFLEKEGMILDSTRTKALVSQLPPGQSVSLQAEIVIPEDISSKLINEVEVVTKETGEKTMTSSAEVQVHKAVQPEQKEEVQNPEPPSEKKSSCLHKAGDRR